MAVVRHGVANEMLRASCGFRRNPVCLVGLLNSSNEGQAHVTDNYRIFSKGLVDPAPQRFHCYSK